jgi:ectoine hydroxylase-related dioxygenase (phytanoyl-CoA dioxygenase family)
METIKPNQDKSTGSLSTVNNLLQSQGSVVLKGIYSTGELKEISQRLEHHKSFQSSSTNEVYAIRQLFKELPMLKKLLINDRLKEILNQFGIGYFLSKAIFFDKPPLSNWYVTWHQDLPINVKEKIAVKGFSSWTKKGNTISTRPPENILHHTITIRVHLDDTNQENGGLKVIPGSHLSILTDSEKQELAKNKEALNCDVKAGGVHIMKPLTLHASSKSKNQQRRRVIHLEFCNVDLPSELQWAERISLSQ